MSGDQESWRIWLEQREAEESNRRFWVVLSSLVSLGLLGLLALCSALREGINPSRVSEPSICVMPESVTPIRPIQVTEASLTRGSGDFGAFSENLHAALESRNFRQLDSLISDQFQWCSSAYPKEDVLGRLQSLNDEEFQIIQRSLSRPSARMGQVDWVRVVPDDWTKGYQSGWWLVFEQSEGGRWFWTGLVFDWPFEYDIDLMVR